MIAALAAKTHGNVTVEQLHAVGLRDWGISHRVKTGRLHRVFLGVYSVGRPPTTPLERACAAVLACGAGSLLSHAPAAALYGWGRWPREPFHVTTTKGDRRPQGITFHRSRALLPRDHRVQLGIRVTSPARTMLDWAPELTDKQLRRAVNDARVSGYLTAGALADIIERFPSHAGAALLRRFIDGGVTRSAKEDDFLDFCRNHGLPRPETNVRVAGREVDALFREQRLIVEVDGWLFHRDRDSFESDRDRDADTLAADHATVRLTAKRMQQSPRREADRLGRILRRRGWDGRPGGWE